MKNSYVEPKVEVKVISAEEMMLGSDVIIDGGDLFSEEENS